MSDELHYVDEITPFTEEDWKKCMEVFGQHRFRSEMSENTVRDTHFHDFAEKLYEKLARNVLSSEKRGLSDIEGFKQEQYLIIARAAYDLVEYAFENQPLIPHIALGVVLSNEEIIGQVPDFTEWPEETVSQTEQSSV